MENKITRINKATILLLALLVPILIGFGFNAYQDINAKMANTEAKLNELERNSAQFARIAMTGTQTATPESTPDMTEAPIKEGIDEHDILGYLNKQHAFIKQLQNQLTNLQDQVNTISKTSDEIIPPPAEAELEKMMSKVDESGRQYIEKIESDYQAQVMDDTWAYDNSLKIEYSLDELKNDLNFNQFSIENIDCRTSTCKVEILHSSEARDIEMLKMELSASLAESLPNSTSNNHINLDGSTKSIYYFFK